MKERESFVLLIPGCVHFLPFTGSDLILEDLDNSTCFQLQAGPTLEDTRKIFHVQSECVTGDQVFAIVYYWGTGVSLSNPRRS